MNEVRYSPKFLIDQLPPIRRPKAKPKKVEVQKRVEQNKLPKGKTYLQLIPEKVYRNFNAIESKLRPTIKGYSTDNLKEIISIIACHIRKDEQDTPLKMQYLKKLVPQGDKYLIGLIDQGIVNRSGHAIKGQSCYKYNFAPEYESKYKTFLLRNAYLIRRIELAQEEEVKDSAKTLKGHSEQIKYLKQLTITEDYSAFINANYKPETEQYKAVLRSAIRIHNGDVKKCNIDNTSYRFHSIVTNMAKELRPFLRVKGEPLVNLDIKNSQLYLSTIILTNPGKVSWMTENPAFALLLQTLKVSLNQDVKTFIHLAVMGEIYEYLMSEFAKQGIRIKRDETKRQVLRILFARNRMPKDETNRKCRQIFKDRFPTVHKIFSKVRGHEKGDKFQNYKRFAILLQRIESYLMLDVILKRIYKELPGVIAITIHDSIMTGILTNNVEAVRKIMAEELTKFVGFRPQIKIEGLNKEKEEEVIILTNTMLQPL